MEKLWNEYFAEECAAVSTMEEKEFARKTLDLHMKANELLTKEQREAVETYVDALCDLQSLFVKKAFFKGWGVATEFLLGIKG